ncbi:MAG: hypothetical protein HY709_02115, partial [Candidatus Latescibacteria bacterium]|nr:hypothetical protein [Candidatus Latescibacterota bacterium]
LRERELEEVGVWEDLPEHRAPVFGDEEEVSRELLGYRALAEANARVSRLIAGDAPGSLHQKALQQLQERVSAYLDACLTPIHLRFRARILFSGRTVIVPAEGLRHDQVGLPEEMAWAFFGPLVTRELRDVGEVVNRSQRAAEKLDAIMARNWVLLNRAPTILPTSFLAFHPVRRPGRVIHVHPFVCSLMNADFDGDQAAVFLPVTEGAQQEAGERLSIAGHLKHNPDLIKTMIPTHDSMWGLASLSLTQAGRREINRLVGIEVATEPGLVTREALKDTLKKVLERDGVMNTLEALERLMWRGFEVAKEAGASISAFIGASIKRLPQPEGNAPEAWNAYAEELAEQIAARSDFEDNDMGVPLLAVKSGARANLDQLRWLVGAAGTIRDSNGKPVPVRHGWRDGLTAQELSVWAFGAHRGLVRVHKEMEELGYSLRTTHLPKRFNVLARAMQAQRPGLVFARAAAIGEIDPLIDIDSRLFVGLPARS